LGREIAQHRDYSESTAQKIDGEVQKLIDNAYDRTKSVLNENLDILHQLAEMLLEKETVLGRELDELILKLRPGIELPSIRKRDEEKAAKSEPPPGPQTESSEAEEAPPDSVPDEDRPSDQGPSES
jgi:cell division protease FtsH